MTWNRKTLVVLALVAVASAATATLAQRAGAEKTAVAGDFAEVDGSYLRLSRIDGIAFSSEGQVMITYGGTTALFRRESCAGLFRALGLPPLLSRPRPRP